LADSKPQKLKELTERLTDYLKSVNAQMPMDKITGEKVKWTDEVIIQKQ